MPPLTRQTARNPIKNATIAAAELLVWGRPARFSSGFEGRLVLMKKWMAAMKVTEEQLLLALNGLTPENLIDDIGAGGWFGDRRVRTRQMMKQAVRRNKVLDGRAELELASRRPPQPEPEESEVEEEDAKERQVRLARKWRNSSKHLLKPTPGGRKPTLSVDRMLQKQLQESAAAQYKASGLF